MGDPSEVSGRSCFTPLPQELCPKGLHSKGDGQNGMKDDYPHTAGVVLQVLSV